MIAVIIIGAVLWFIAHEIGKGAWSIAEDLKKDGRAVIKNGTQI